MGGPILTTCIRPGARSSKYLPLYLGTLPLYLRSPWLLTTETNPGMILQVLSGNGMYVDGGEKSILPYHPWDWVKTHRKQPFMYSVCPMDGMGYRNPPKPTILKGCIFPTGRREMVQILES